VLRATTRTEIWNEQARMWTSRRLSLKFLSPAGEYALNCGSLH
jgi:hypothetical protein